MRARQNDIDKLNNSSYSPLVSPPVRCHGPRSPILTEIFKITIWFVCLSLIYLYLIVCFIDDPATVFIISYTITYYIVPSLCLSLYTKV